MRAAVFLGVAAVVAGIAQLWLVPSWRAVWQMALLQDLAQVTRGLYPTAPPPGELTATLLARAPADLLREDGSLRHGWDGPVTVDSDGQALSIGYRELPRTACILLLMRSPAGRFRRVHAGAAAFVPPVAQHDADRACGESNHIVWVLE